MFFLESVRYCQDKKGLEVYGWSIMSNHVHLIAGTNQNPLEGILRDLKKFTSTKIVEAIKANVGESRREWMLWMLSRAGKKNANNKNNQFTDFFGTSWQQDNHPIELNIKGTSRACPHAGLEDLRQVWTVRPLLWIIATPV